ncbi:MAG: cupin domain-containing protein [Methylococcaceae bacterium]|nr:cupin domain-containing protein [Prolixibacteraceae bacterium]
MKTSGLPEMTPFKVGETVKVLQVTGEAGAKVPEHYSTMEAVIIVQEGDAQLEINDEKHLLHAGTVFIIPAGKNHTLTLKSRFKAMVIMSKVSEVKFVE